MDKALLARPGKKTFFFLVLLVICWANGTASNALADAELAPGDENVFPSDPPAAHLVYVQTIFFRGVGVSSSEPTEMWLAVEPDIVTLELNSIAAATVEFSGLFTHELYHVYVDTHLQRQELYASNTGTLKITLEPGWHLVDLSIPEATLVISAQDPANTCRQITAQNAQGDVVTADYIPGLYEHVSVCQLPPDSQDYSISEPLSIEASNLVFDCNGATIDGRSSSNAVSLRPEFGQLGLRNGLR